VPSIMIADFSGMAPIRDELLLPDNVAQYCENAWLYRGQVRGFRMSVPVYTLQYADTQQVYRIPIDPNAPTDFSPAGSIWLEYPDPYMSTIRNPTVGDTYERYYFFPSDQYAATGANPSWPATSPGAVYNTKARIQAGNPPYTLGIPVPSGGAPTVTPAGISASTTATANLPPGGVTLNVASVAGVLKGMLVQDANDLTVSAPTNAASAVGGNSLSFSSTAGILVGMSIRNQTNPSSLLAGCQVTSLTGTTVTMNFTIFSPGVANGDTIIFENVNAIPQGTTVAAVGTLQVTLSNGTVNAGVRNGDTIRFATATSETRAYVYTYVSGFNEEGPPSAATVATGDGTGMWTVVIPTPPAGDFTNRNLTQYRLYRTVTDSSGNASYYQVTQVPINFSGPVTIHDSAQDGIIVANQQLETIGYTPPPPKLQGVVMMANGIAAGFTNEREVWFSAPFLPHSWPAAYALTVDYPIVGLTANGNSLNIITEGSPFIATGVTPDTMTMGKITAFEPCISRGSIVSSGEGAYYASPNGLQLLNTGGTTNMTLPAMEKEFFNNLQPPKFAAGRYGAEYFCLLKGMTVPPIYGSEAGATGFVFAVQNDESPNEMFTYIKGYAPVQNVYPDEIAGQLFAVAAGAVIQIYPIIGEGTFLRTWKWKTKKFRYTYAQEFKAFMVLFEVPPEVTITPGVRNTDQAQVFNPATQYMIARIYRDGVLVVVRELQKSGEVLLIPAGTKGELWEAQFEGQVTMKFFKMASSVKELKAV
jgi:hypothetical protein